MCDKATNRKNPSGAFGGAVDGGTNDGAGSGRADPLSCRCVAHGSTDASREDRTVGDLVEAAQQGDQGAWDALVRRYVPLVRAITRTYRLAGKDAEDVSQVVWLRLVEQLARIREPLALPKWIVTTARRESRRVAASLNRTVLVDPLVDTRQDHQRDHAEVEAGLLRAEERQALRDGLAELPPAQREMLLLLTADPPLSYRQISRVLGIPVGSIGPMRARCLQRLRATSALRPFLVTSTAATPPAASPRHRPAA
jgi:RNA polymerase sigma factor (sigma-70 family)